MRIEFVKSWRSVKQGDVLEMPDGAANVLVMRGIAKTVEVTQRRPDAPLRYAGGGPAAVATEVVVGHKRGRRS